MKQIKLTKQGLSAAMLLVALLSLVAAVIVLFSAIGAQYSYQKVLLGLSTVLLFLLCGLAVYYLYLSRESDPNFFLYDQTEKRNIPVEELTFERVDERLEFYLSLICDSDDELWQGAVLAKSDGSFGRQDVYRPLVAYKMLYDLAAADDEVRWALIEQSEITTMRLLTRALKQGGDAEMAQALVDLYKGDNVEEGENLRDFLVGNLKYLKSRAVRYVKQHLDYFY